MILFHDDWKDYPDAILDTTTNPSFTRMAALYRAMGIKNHSWMLALHDPSLLGKDPFAEDITAETALAFSIEFKENPWAFFRFIARDPAGSNEFPIQFVANRGILASYWLFFNHILTLLIMIRQTGKSFGLDWLYTYLLNVRLTKSDISFLTKDEKLRGRELERLKAMELTMPVWMKQRKSTDPGNTEILRISSLENTFRAYVPNKSPKLADLIGRGMTAGITGVDEFAYIHNSWITIPVMLSASLAAREVAKMKNEPYGTLFATTSGKRDTPEGKYAYNFMSKAAVWNEAFMDAENHEHLCEMILKASPGEVLHVNCTFNHRQLGKDDKWLKDRLKESIQEDPVQVSADFLNEWPSGSNLTPFSPEQAKAIRESEVLDFYTQFAQPEAYALRWYYPEDQIKTRMQDPHVLSLDPSDAVGQDAIGITLRNVYTGEVAMAADVSEGNLILFSRWICGFLHEYQSVTAIVERRSSGVMILDYLLLYLPAAGMDPFRRLFNFVVQDAEEAKQRFEEIKNPMNSRDNLFVKYKKLFGFATSGSGATSRTDLYSRTLNNAVKMTGSLLKDRKLILQTLGLEIRNGRVDHGEGEHDDLVISWLLSYWLLSMGKNLRHYGIEPSKILSLNPMYQSQLQEQSAYDQYQTHKARHDVEQLTEQLKIESDEYVARRLEYDLELAIGRLSDQDRQIVSADDLIHKLREERTQRIRRSHSYGYSPNYGLSSGGTNRDPFRAPGQYGATVADYNPGDVVYTRF